MPTAPDLQNRMKFWHFLNVLQNSWNLQNLLKSPPETCMWNLRQFGEVTIFDRKMPKGLDLQNRMKFWDFLKVLQNSWNLQKLLESPPETCMWNLRQFGEVTIFDRKMPTAPNLQNRMKFWDFLNVLQNSWNLQKLLESPPETCMWNLRQFGEVPIFDGKCRQRRTFITGWNFDIFSMFSKIHDTYRIYWNLHQKHACEIWGSSKKLQFLMEKCLQRWTFKTGWNFEIFSKFSKIHETYRSYWNHHQKHACEIWGISEKLQLLTEKCLQRRTLKTGWNLDIFSMFSKIHETYRIYWNHHQKHACEIWSSLEKLQFLTEKCLQRRTFKTGWNFDIFSMFSKIHETYRSYWNHHQKHACEIWGSSEKLQFWWKMPTALDLKNRMKFWHFLNVLQNSWHLVNSLESPLETSMWNLRQFGEVTIFDRKCRQRSPFKTGWNFDFFSMFFKISWNLQKLLESPLETSMWNLRQIGEVTIFDGKCRPSKQDKILIFFQCSPKFMKVTEVIGITTRNMHVKFEAVQRSYNFWRKNAYSAGPSKQDEILTFSQCSPKFMKLTEFIGITTRNMHVKCEAVWRSYSFWWKMPTAPDLQNRMKFWHFLNVLQNSWNLQKLLESPPETCMWNLRQFGEVTIFDGKMPTAPDLQNGMKFRHFLNVLQNSWHLQNLLKSPPETCMWNLRQFGEVTIFDRKMPTAPSLQNRMKFWHFLNVLQNSWNLQNLLESPPEACMWNLRQFGEVTIFDRKMPTAPDLQNRMKFWHFLNVLQNSWNLQKLLDHHQKHACEIWGSLEKLQFLTEKCLQRQTLKTGWNLDIFSMFSKIHDT